MARTARAGTWRVHDRSISLPVTITDARAAVAVFRASPDAARGVLAGTGLTPWTVAGQAVGVLGVVRYGPWVLGRYDEVAVGVAVRGPGGRRGLHLVDLPVTGSFTRDAGRAIWSLPKWLMTAEVHLTDDATSVVVETAPAAPRHPLPPARRDATDTAASDTQASDTQASDTQASDTQASGYAVGRGGGGAGGGAEFVLRARLGAGRVRVPFPVRVRIPLWSVLPDGPRAGVLLRGAMPVRLRGVRLGRGRARVELGSHPMAGRMAALGMTRRPLLTVTATGLRGQLGLFTAAVRGGCTGGGTDGAAPGADPEGGGQE
ncbi:acetoacetate decarboxylase family protein [Frankia sp. QA3]|uniref:acetoacetate decarboxylase family protein n=1 Tax=Frankia sp. QA3 TaxID=710111 RepID=UPI000269BCC8|nr:acetoacetate decarboxylase family protein [Frankia sp. QA3]EIV92245.1 Acetoacetate decarboxylase (ADC) [Frankia sp. QA3]